MQSSAIFPSSYFGKVRKMRNKTSPRQFNSSCWFSLRGKGKRKSSVTKNSTVGIVLTKNPVAQS